MTCGVIVLGAGGAPAQLDTSEDHVTADFWRGENI